MHPRKVCLARVSRFLALALSMLMVLTSTPVLVLPTFASSSITSRSSERPPLEFVLSEVDNPGKKRESARPVAAKPLPAGRAEAILSRLTALPLSSEQVEQKLVLPEDSLVRPVIPGNQISEIFPVKNRAGASRNLATVRDGLAKPLPLRVSRISHSGNADKIDQLAITFSQPLIALTQVGAAPNKFVTITPQPKGEWKWAGTQTLLFCPAGGRFPKATKYVVNVPSSASSVGGGKVEKATRWIITTPAAKLENFYPSDRIGLSGSDQLSTTPVFLAIFNQSVDAKEILAKTIVRAGKQLYSVRQLSQAELLSKDPSFKPLIPPEAGCWVAFAATSAFNKDALVKVVFDKSLPSAEGPLLSNLPDTRAVKIHGKFCLSAKPIAPRAGEQGYLELTFSNGIKQDCDLKSLVTIAPEVKRLTRSVMGSRLTLQGDFKAKTVYQVKIGKNLADDFGQNLGHDCLIKVQTGLLDRQIVIDRSFKTYTTGGAPRFSAWAQGGDRLKVEIRKVEAKDFVSFKQKLDRPDVETIGKPVHTEVYPIGFNGRQVNVDLKPYLPKYGHLLVRADFEPAPKQNPVWAKSWIQVSDIGLDVFNSKDLEILATGLKDASPLSGVELQLLGKSAKVITNAKGQAVVTRQSSNSVIDVLVGKKGDDTSILTPDEYGGLWQLNQVQESLRWYTVSDRNLYKPNEVVSVKGLLRKLSYTAGGGISLSVPPIGKVSYSVVDNMGTEIGVGSGNLDKLGSFSFELKLPAKVSLGQAEIRIKTGESFKKVDNTIQSDAQTSLPITIAEFRQPEFEMKVSTEQSGPFVLGDTVNITAAAKYLVGGGLADSAVHWVVTPSRASYAPPGWPGFGFDNNFDFYQWMEERRLNQVDFKEGQKTLTGTTDSDGSSTLAVKFISTPYPVPMSYQCQATVADVNRQTWTDTTSIVVNPSDLCVGIKKDKPYYLEGDLVNLEFVACDLNGKLKAGTTIDVELTQLDSEQKTITSKSSLTIGSEPAKLQFRLAKSTTSFSCSATAKDAGSRVATSVENGSVSAPEKKIVDIAQLQTIQLTADKSEYQPGDVAELTITSPFKPAKGLLIITRNKNLSSTPIVIDSAKKTISIPIVDDYYPIVRAQVYLAGSAVEFASATIDLAVPPKARRLNLTAKCEQEFVAPGHETTIDIELKDWAGKPVKDGQVALAVVDESVLALTGYRWPDPMDFFYPADLPGVSESHSRAAAIVPILAKTQSKSDLSSLPPPSAMPGPMPMGGPGGMMDGQPPPPPSARQGLVGAPVDPRFGQSNEVGQLADYGIAGSFIPEIVLRKTFAALAIFKPITTTDIDGRAKVVFRLPDNVTRYRIMAMAVSGSNQFGATESLFTAQMPLMVKPSPPRFMQLTDRCELPVVIQNQTDNELLTEVAVRGQNVEILESGKLVAVPAHDRVEVGFATKATNVGAAQFQCAAVSGNTSDAAEFNFPVLIPASSESFATYGVVDRGIALQKLDVPKDVLDKLGGLSVETSSTAVQSLTDAYIYLRDYPYQCSEQMSSRLMAMLALQDTLNAFGILKPEEQVAYRSRIQNDIDILQLRQSQNGGFGLWKANEDVRWPYVSIQVSKALGLAQEKHYKVKKEILANSLSHLRKIETFIPADYSESVKIAVIAQALNVRQLLKDSDPAAAKRLLQRALNPKQKSKSLSLEVAAWLLVILDKQPAYSADVKLLRNYIDSQIKETASTASANEIGYDGLWDYCIFASPRRTDASILEALMVDQPKSELVPKLVKGLLAHRKNGAWEGTQENSSVLQALDRYFRTYEKQTPDIVAQTWLDNTLVANHKFVGRTTDSRLTKIPMSYLLDKEASEVLINKQGPGRLYYRLALDYVPQSLSLKPIDQGFAVTRDYSSVDAKSDVQKDSDGIWHFKSGSTVRVKVHLESLGVRYHVAMADPIAAGAEPINTALLGGRADIPIQDVSDSQYWYRPWYEHHNLRDHQAEAFSSLLPAGAYDFTYTIQASTPGRYTVPPVKVEEMYMSETFGRSQTDTIVIE